MRAAFHEYGLGEGLPGLNVFHAIQDQAGYLWFATESGISQMDAFENVHFSVREGLAQNDIRRLHLDQQGRLWALSVGALSRRENGRFAVLDSLPWIGPDRVLSIAEDHKGGIWLATSRSVHYLTPDDRVTEYQLGDLGLTQGANLIGTDLRGKVWLADHRQVLLLGPNMTDTVSFLLRYPSQPNSSLPRFLLQASGEYIYSSPAGLVKGHSNGRQMLFLSADTLTHWDALSSLQMDNRGDLWAALKNGGLLWLMAEEDTFHPPIYLLADLKSNYLFLDREQNLWICTKNEGLLQLTTGAIDVFRQRHLQFQKVHALFEKIPGPPVHIASDRQKALWLAWDNGTLMRLKGLRGSDIEEVSYSLPALFPDFSQINDLLVLADGTVLVATNQGLILGDENGFSLVPGVLAPRSLSESDDGEIFIGTLFNSGYRTSLDSLKVSTKLGHPLSPSGVLSGLQISRVVKDQSQNLWLAWLGGLVEIDPEGTRLEWREKEPIFRARISDMALGADSTLWLATKGSGLVAHKAAHQYVVDRAQGLKSGVVHSLWVDSPDSVVWVGTEAGLGRVEAGPSLRQPFSVHWFDCKDGLALDAVWQVHLFQDLVLVLGPAGLTILEKDRLEEPGIPPAVFLREIRVGEQVYQMANQPLLLPFDSNSVSIRFGAIGFRYPGQIRFRYRLQGGDNQWIETDKTTLTYPNLSPGTYRWEVMALDQDQQVSQEPAHFEFQILPPFYRTPWFVTLMFLGVVVLLIFLSLYLSHLRQRNLLERKVDEKTFALQAKVNELARANDDLGQFAYVASHDLKTPLRTIINYLQLLERRYKGKLDTDADQYIDFAVSSSKQLYQLINDLLVYSELGQKRQSLEPLDLHEVVAKIQLTLKDWMKEKNASLISGSLPQVSGVRTEWELLLRNLIENGIKFNEKPNPTVTIECKDSPGFWIFSVADNGIGIPQNYQQKIFQLFQRLHTHEFPGNGLGLTMCKRIVEMQGGNIWLESEPDRGTFVFFSIPKEGKQTTL